MGRGDRFSVSVSENTDPENYEVIVVDLENSKARLYRGGDRWVPRFKKDLAEGNFER
jgi:hypothetical protein